MPNDYSYKNNYLTNNATNIEVLVLGSSHSLSSINPEYFSKISFNAAHSSQSLYYDYLIFQKFRSNLKNLKILIIPISYFSLFYQLKDGADNWIIKNYSIYYDIGHNSVVPNLEFANEKPILIFKRLKKYISPNSKTINVSKLGYGLSYSNNASLDIHDTGLLAAKRHTKDSYEYLDMNLELLNQIVIDSNQIGVEVILFTPPAYSSYTNHLSPRQKSLMYTSINKLVHSHQNVRYYSFLEDKRFLRDDFNDADHLNEAGAKKMTGIMNKIVTDLLASE